MFVVSFLLLLPTAALPSVLPWSEWRLAFDRADYGSPAELAWREAGYDTNVAMIMAHNNGPHGATWKMGVNRFSDMNASEFAEWSGRMGSLRGAATVAEVAVQRRAPSARDAAHLAAKRVALRSGELVDWRDEGAVTPIRNQILCAGCYAFATAGALEGSYQIATGELISLSVQEILDCTHPGGNDCCVGGTFHATFRFIMAGGLNSEEDYSFVSTDGKSQQCWYAGMQRVVATMSHYVDVASCDEEALAAAVLIAPVAVGVRAVSRVFQHYKSGVMSDGVHCGTEMTHAVLIVGITDEAYIIKNSWGEGFGDEGYIQLQRNWNASDERGICGIAQIPVYAHSVPGTPLPLPPLNDQSTRPGPGPCGG